MVNELVQHDKTAQKLRVTLAYKIHILFTQFGSEIFFSIKITSNNGGGVAPLGNRLVSVPSQLPSRARLKKDSFTLSPLAAEIPALWEPRVPTGHWPLNWALVLVTLIRNPFRNPTLWGADNTWPKVRRDQATYGRTFMAFIAHRDLEEDIGGQKIILIKNNLCEIDNLRYLASLSTWQKN